MRAGFEGPVPPNGYVWWYLDALSDDRRHGLTLIAMVGNVFSPYYARARRRGVAEPENHCALNVALYGDGGKRWAMTERGRTSLRRSSTALEIGPSALVWDGNAFVFAIDEVTVPVPSRIRGTVRVHPEAISERAWPLDERGRHRWRPIAPCARVEVRLERPALRWVGGGYLDMNAGDEPLEDGFSAWTWSRGSVHGGTAVLYDVARKGGAQLSLALRFDAAGRVDAFGVPPSVALPHTLWRIPRSTRSESVEPPAVMRTLEDAPFYARSIVSTRLLGESITAVHESLSLDRFRARWVQMLLPFRMPRAWR